MVSAEYLLHCYGFGTRIARQHGRTDVMNKVIVASTIMVIDLGTHKAGDTGLSLATELKQVYVVSANTL